MQMTKEKRYRDKQQSTKLYWSRTNYRHLLLVVVRLFLYHSIHPFKYPVIFNVTLRLTLDGNIFNFPVHAHIRDPLKSC